MNIGILGFAHGHVRSYIGAWQAAPELGVRVVAGWDHDPARQRDALAAFGLEPAASPEALLARSDIEAVVIAAETSRHADLVEQAAAAGKAVALQKPLALTLEEADRIVASVEAAGVPFTLAWQMRVDPQNLRMKQWIEDGTLGRIFMVRRRHGLSLLLTEPAFKNTWHVDPAANRDMWADDAAHAIDFLYWLFGMPASVTAELATLWDPEMPNDNGVALFRYPDGMIAEVSASFTCVAGENTTEIVAERGVVVQNFGDAPSAAAPPPGGIALKWFPRGAKAWAVADVPTVSAQGDRIRGLAAPLADFFRGRRPPIATAREGRDVLRMTLACYASSADGRRMPLP